MESGEAAEVAGKLVGVSGETVRQAKQRQGKRTDLTSPDSSGEVGGESVDLAGKTVGVSGDTVRQAKRLMEEAPGAMERCGAKLRPRKI